MAVSIEWNKNIAPCGVIGLSDCGKTNGSPKNKGVDHERGHENAAMLKRCKYQGGVKG